MAAGIPWLIHYLDDFLFFLPPSHGLYAQVWSSYILGMFHRLGVPIAFNKIEGPSTKVTFLGIVVDTDLQQLRLPDDKLDFVRQLICRWLGRRSGKVKDFESLLGHLSHTALVTPDGRIFLRHSFFTPSKSAVPTSPHPPGHHSQSRFAVVELLSPIMEWPGIFCPPQSPVFPCLYRCFRIFWLWRCAHSFTLVSVSVAIFMG